jgi:hypothetical protein
MSKRIQASVGRYGGGTKECHNLPGDQMIIQDLLNRIPVAAGGAGWQLNEPIVKGQVGPQTYEAILRFQRRYFQHPDGHVAPDGPTLDLLNRLAGQGSLRPELDAVVTVEPLGQGGQGCVLRLSRQVDSASDTFGDWAAVQGRRALASPSGFWTYESNQFLLFLTGFPERLGNLLVLAGVGPNSSAEPPLSFGGQSGFGTKKGPGQLPEGTVVYNFGRQT